MQSPQEAYATAIRQSVLNHVKNGRKTVIDVMLREVLVHRAAFHTYRGEALVERVRKLVDDYRAWRSQKDEEQGYNVTEDQAVEWLAGNLEALEKENP